MVKWTQTSQFKYGSKTFKQNYESISIHFDALYIIQTNKTGSSQETTHTEYTIYYNISIYLTKKNQSQ